MFAVRVGNDLWLWVDFDIYAHRETGDVWGKAGANCRKLYASYEEARLAAELWVSTERLSVVDGAPSKAFTIVAVKETILDSHYASGDCECFCFDTLSQAERDSYRENGRLAFEKASAGVSVESDEYDRLYDKYLGGIEDSRVYPHVLLPDTHGRKGRWKITAEFEPDESLACLHDSIGSCEPMK